MNDQPSYNWDQAELLNLWPPRSFEAVGIPAGTVRRWASLGLIAAAGHGPNGARLYRYNDVVEHAQNHGWRPRARVRIH